MADAEPAPSPPAVAPLPSPSKKDRFQALRNRIAGRWKHSCSAFGNLQNWRSKLDTRVKTYKDELSELKKALKTELGQLRSEFKDLRTTLQTQRHDATLRLNDLVIRDAPEQTEEPNNRKVEDGIGEPEAPSFGNS